MYLLTRDARRRKKQPGRELRREGILNPEQLEKMEEREIPGLIEPRPKDRRHTKGRLPNERR